MGKPRTTPTEHRRYMAYHEAGHAVVAWRLRMPFQAVSIVPTAESLGHVQPAPWRLRDEHLDNPSPRVRDRLECRAIILLAGCEAERLARGRYNHVSARVDRKHALMLIDPIAGSGDELTAYVRWLWARAQTIVHTHRPQIAAVAEALLQQGTLTGEDVRQVILTSYGITREVNA